MKWRFRPPFVKISSKWLIIAETIGILEYPVCLYNMLAKNCKYATEILNYSAVDTI